MRFFKSDFIDSMLFSISFFLHFSYPGGAIFYIQDESEKKYYLHVGDHRISCEINENILLANSEIHYIYFDPS